MKIIDINKDNLYKIGDNVYHISSRKTNSIIDGIEIELKKIIPIPLLLIAIELKSSIIYFSPFKHAVDNKAKIDYNQYSNYWYILRKKISKYPHLKINLIQTMIKVKDANQVLKFLNSKK